MNKILLAIISMCFVASPAYATVFYATPSVVSLTTASTKLLDQDNMRTYLIIQNQGTANIIVKAFSAITGTEGVIIPPGGNYEPYLAPGNAVYAKSATGTNSVTIVQGH